MNPVLSVMLRSQQPPLCFRGFLLSSNPSPFYCFATALWDASLKSPRKWSITGSGSLTSGAASKPRGITVSFKGRENKGHFVSSQENKRFRLMARPRGETLVSPNSRLFKMLIRVANLIGALQRVSCVWRRGGGVRIAHSAVRPRALTSP